MKYPWGFIGVLDVKEGRAAAPFPPIPLILSLILHRQSLAGTGSQTVGDRAPRLRDPRLRLLGTELRVVPKPGLRPV
jgi:hypothetical protein